MAIETIPEFLYPPAGLHNYQSYGASAALDTLAKRFAFLITASRGYTIDGVGFTIGTVTTPGTLKVSIQAIDPATGLPDGIDVNVATVAIAGPDAGAYKEVTFDTPNEFSRDETFGVVFVWSGGVAGNITFRTLLNSGSGSDNGFQGSAFCAFFDGVWTRSATLVPNVYLNTILGNQSVIWGNYPFFFLDTTSIDINSSEIALRFMLETPMRCLGSWVFANRLPGSFNPLSVSLYDEDGVTLKTVAFHPKFGIDSPTLHVRRWGSGGVNMDADKVYRLGVRATGAIGDFIQLASGYVGNNEAMRQLPGGSKFYASSRIGGAAWTDFEGVRPFMGLVISGVSSEPVAKGGPVVSSSHVHVLSVRGKVL